jgi:hypothetical protein
MIYSATSQLIMGRLAEGPATNRQLQDAAYTHGADVARRMIDLARHGHVRRVDQNSGRGKPATYALRERP